MKKHTKKPDTKKVNQPDTEELVSAAYTKLEKTPLAGLADEIPRIHCDASYPMAKNDWGYVTSKGHIYLNPRQEGTIGEWVYVLAHCMLHLGMGHLVEICKDDPVWHAVCDIVVTRFLLESHIGTPPIDVHRVLEYPDAEEMKLYEKFTDSPDASTLPDLSMMSQGRGDMLWEGESKYHDFEEAFAESLQEALKESIQIAGGLTKEECEERREYSPYQRAREWFVNSYPLLGALAAEFRLIDNTETVRRMNIPIAAVNPQLQEIYINRRCGLSSGEWKFVLAHEFLHAALRHDVRRAERDPVLWNVACDYVVNGWLVEMKVGDMPDGLLHDEHFKGMSAETVYDTLCENIRYYQSLDPKDIVYGEEGWWDAQNGAETDAFYRSAIQRGLEFHQQRGRGALPGNFVEEVRAISRPPIRWDVELAKWFDEQFCPAEPHRTYARLSRRQSATPDIPRAAWIVPQEMSEQRVFGVLLDTSGSMDRALLAAALGSIVSYSEARDVHRVRVVFCDAAAYDQGMMSPEEIAGTVKIRGRGGTKLQPGIDLLDADKKFPKDAPLLIITDGACDRLNLRGRKHAFLIPAGCNLPFAPRGPVFRLR